MANNEISVELRLKMEKLAQDAAKAGKIISENIASSIKGSDDDGSEPRRKSSSKKMSSQQKEDERIRKIDEAEKKRAEQESLKALRAKMVISRNAAAFEQRQQDEARRYTLWRMGIMRNSQALEERATAKQKALFEKNNPMPGQNNGKLNPAGLLAGLGLGIPGLGAIASLASVNPAAAALTASFRTLKASVEAVWSVFKQASEQARKNYASTLQSGLGLGMTIKRSNLAEIIGVGENDVWQYGAAVQALNNRIEYASQTLAETTGTLTASSWNIKVLQLDIEALGAKMAVEVAPAVNMVVRALDGLVNLVSRNMNILKWLASGALKGMLPTLGFGLGTAMGVIGGMASDASGSSKEQAPSPVSFMKRMQASQWERMGLVIGGSGATNYGKKTADNTGKMIMQLEAVKLALQFSSRGIGVPMPSLASM